MAKVFNKLSIIKIVQYLLSYHLVIQHTCIERKKKKASPTFRASRAGTLVRATEVD